MGRRNVWWLVLQMSVAHRANLTGVADFTHTVSVVVVCLFLCDRRCYNSDIDKQCSFSELLIHSVHSQCLHSDIFAALVNHLLKPIYNFHGDSNLICRLRSIN